VTDILPPRDHPSHPAVDAASTVSALVRARADEAEQTRRLPADLVAALTDAGLFRLFVPTA